MANASYERQHLALQAAGYISGDGATQTTFGCQMTRIGTGDYQMILGPSDGVISDETFVFATAKSALPVAVVAPAAYFGFAADDHIKIIWTYSSANLLADCDIEVALFKSVTR